MNSGYPVSEPSFEAVSVRWSKKWR